MIKQRSRRKYCKRYAKEWHRSEPARLLATLVRCITVSLFDRVFRNPGVPYRQGTLRVDSFCCLGMA